MKKHKIILITFILQLFDKVRHILAPQKICTHKHKDTHTKHTLSAYTKHTLSAYTMHTHERTRTHSSRRTHTVPQIFDKQFHLLICAPRNDMH